MNVSVNIKILLLFFLGKISPRKKSTPSDFIGEVLFYFLISAAVAGLTALLPLILLIHLNDQIAAIVTLLLGFCLLFGIIIFGIEPGNFFPMVLLRAFFNKLPIKPNHTSILSIPPTDYKIQLKETTSESTLQPHTITVDVDTPNGDSVPSIKDKNAEATSQDTEKDQKGKIEQRCK